MPKTLTATPITSRRDAPFASFTVPELSDASQERTAQLTELRRRGVTVPQLAFRDADKDVPGHTVRGWN